MTEAGSMHVCMLGGRGLYVFSRICGHTYKINGTSGGCLIYFPIRLPNLKNQNGQ